MRELQVSAKTRPASSLLLQPLRWCSGFLLQSRVAALKLTSTRGIHPWYGYLVR